MATLTLNVPDDLLDEARARLGRGSAATVEEYLLSAIESLATEGKTVDEQTEAKLVEALGTPLKTADQVDWDAKLKRIG